MMGFDFENFGIGLLTGWATAYGVYRARHLLGATMRSVQQQAETAQSFATQSADNRYVNDFIRLAETAHLAGHFVNLSNLVIEPRFISTPPLAAPPDEDKVSSVFHVVPVIPDYPYLHAPYNLETMSIDDLSTGDRSIALLGRPGSGRTTALMTIGLRCLGKVNFDPPVDKVQQRIAAEDAALNDKQRAVRAKERQMIEQRAKERLAEERGETFETDAETKTDRTLFSRLMPVYVQLADIDPADTEFGKTVDPAEPLLRSIQRQVGRITASTIPRNFYERLERGQVILLVDGYDELPEAEQSQKLAWLQALRAEYPQNFYIVAAPVVGYGPLLRLGLTPVYLRPWADADMNRAADNWSTAWSNISGKRRLGKPDLDPAAIDRAKTNNRALSPFDLTLKIWGNYANDAETPGLEGWLRAVLTRQLPPNQALGLLMPQLIQAAVLQLDEGYITQARLEALFVGRTVAEIQEEAPAEETAKAKKKKKGEADKKEETSAQAKFLNLLRQSKLVVRYPGGRYLFTHSLLAAYLASLHLKDHPDLLAEKAMQPRWQPAMAFAALHTPLDAAVRARLSAPTDILNNQALEVAYWLAYAPADAPWRTQYLKFLGNLLVTPLQFPYVRERAAAALLTTRDKGVAVLFRQALRSNQPHLRRLGVLALGAIGDAEAVAQIAPLLQDENNDTQLAAGLALGAIGSESALEALVDALTQGSEQLRQAAAETFAAIPDEGYPILYDAIQDEDMLLRRAAVFGLRRVPAGWALIAVYRAFLEDGQWYVRSAAQIAFQELQYGSDKGVKSYPPVDSLEWLDNWAAKRGENLPSGEGANQMLMRALQEGEPEVRQLAAASIGQLGLASIGKALYGAMRDRQPEIRDITYRALADLQSQIGQPLPTPV
ncbi:MAG TPA: HEAT repeat domain-containing protein [Phototrophicaceae bacterium]|nr:HEAT repeat domain-containing protein [Phototrophicaceae bacterium]